MKVLVADKFPADGLTRLTEAGCTVHYDADLAKAALVEAVKTHAPQVLIVRGTEVPGEAMRGSSLSLVVRAGAGYNTIDVKTASELGIYVSNCPGKNAQAVAELALGLILAADRQIPDGVSDLRSGVWNKTKYSKARGLYGRTLGVIGLGSIGSDVVARGRAFGMKVVAWSRSLDEAGAKALGVTRMGSPKEVAAAADVVTVHLALNADTRGLLNKEFFEALKPGAIFINTSRAEVVDQAAMVEAVKGKKVRLGLDVFAGEPSGGTGEVDKTLFQEPGVYATHHIGASTDQAQEAIGDEAIRIVLEFKRTGQVPNCVNVAKRTPATHLLVVRHRDRVGVLAHVFGQLRDAGINVQQTENVVFDGAVAAVARIQVDQEPSAATLDAIKKAEDIYEVGVVALK